MAKPLRETLRHQSAFEFYFALGSDRSLAQVAERFGVTPQAVEGWSVAFRWQKRLAERERIIAAHREKTAVQDYAKSREEQLQIIRFARAKFAAALKGDKVRFTASDLERLGKLENLLRGEATERQHVKIDANVTHGFVLAVVAAIERVIPDAELRQRLVNEIEVEANKIGPTAPDPVQ